MQPAQARRKRLVLSRLIGMAATGRSIPKYRGLHMVEAARRAGLLSNAKSLLGIIRRLVMGRW